MRSKWKYSVVFQELELQYGTFTAIAMMEDAAKSSSFVPWSTSRRGIVVWALTKYPHLWSPVLGGLLCSG